MAEWPINLTDEQVSELLQSLRCLSIPDLCTVAALSIGLLRDVQKNDHLVIEVGDIGKIYIQLVTSSEYTKPG